MAQAVVVMLVAMLEIWAAVPAGLAMGLPAPLVWTATVVGGTASIALIVVVGDRVRAWILGRFGHGATDRGGRMRRVWERYGVIGWGLLAPLVLGAPLAAVLGVTFGASRGRLLAWLAVGVVLWSTALTAAAALGLREVSHLA
jgi:hypothetical protein